MRKTKTLATLLLGLSILTSCIGGRAETPRGDGGFLPVRVSTNSAVCERSVDPSIVRYGYNRVVDASGREVHPQGRPIQAGYQLVASDTYVEDHNAREYAQVFAFMGQIREALMCGLDGVSKAEWADLTEVLTLNKIKTTQNLNGTPKQRYYSSTGIYDHISGGPDFHPMMKYLEEAELELKCLALKDFNFVNPEGVNHCRVHGIVEGSGLKLP